MSAASQTRLNTTIRGQLVTDVHVHELPQPPRDCSVSRQYRCVHASKRWCTEIENVGDNTLLVIISVHCLLQLVPPIFRRRALTSFIIVTASRMNETTTAVSFIPIQYICQSRLNVEFLAPLTGQSSS